jgi:GT2 family glycosyltransferase
MHPQGSEGEPIRDRRVRIVVLNWNDWGGTLKCLERVFRSNYPDYRVIVVDNASRDHSVEQFKAWAEGRLAADATGAPPQLPPSAPVPKPIPFVEVRKTSPEGRVEGGDPDVPLTIISTGDNRGYAGGNNIGISHALDLGGCEYVLLLNNDALVAPDTVGTLVRVAREAGAAVVGARVWDEQGTRELFAGASWPGHLFGRPPSRRETAGEDFWESSYADGCAILLRGDLLSGRFAESGYFIDPAYFIYWEEVDLCLYAHARGGRCVVARDAFVYHGLAKSFGGSLNPRGLYYQTRNRIYLANRWLNNRWKLLFHAYFLPSRVLAQVLGGRRRWRREVVRAVWHGLVDGYAGVMGRWKYH